MTLAQFISNETGQAVSYDGLAADVGQCEQLVCVYWQQVYGFRCPPIADAFMLWTNPTILANFDQVPVGDEQPGDAAVFDHSTLINSPVAGHTDIYVKDNGNGTWTGFDSNWGGVVNSKGQPTAHLVSHTNTDVLGFLRWKGGNMDAETVLQSALNAERATNAQLQNTVYVLQSALNAARAQVAELQAQSEYVQLTEPVYTKKI